MVAITNNILALMSGLSWTASGHSTSISYTILGEETTDRLGRTVNRVPGEIEQAVNAAVTAWNSVANVNFHFVENSTVNASDPFATDLGDIEVVFKMSPVEQDADAGILIGSSHTLTATGETTISGAEVKLDNRVLLPSDFVSGAGFQVVLRVVGLVLGLANPDEDGATTSFVGLALEGNDATLDGTVMHSSTSQLGTHTTVAGFPAGPQIHDIAAIQFMYGANHNYHPGNDTYTYTDAAVAQTIWDGAGTDIIDFSSVTTAVTIDLQEGIDNVTQAGSTRVWIAIGANIEGGKGGSGDDTITGNALANNLLGNAGEDTITAGEGADTVNGNADEDSISGGGGNDSLRGGRDADTIAGNADDDQLFGDMGADSVRGGQGADTIHGGKGADDIFGDDGVDIIYGDMGDDDLTGGDGVDIFVFAASNGVDAIADFVDGTDLLQIASTIFTTAADAIAASTRMGSSVFIDFGDGNSVQVTGITSLDAGDLVIA